MCFPSITLITNGDLYPPGQITFSRKHMIFLIMNLPLLQDGVYPRQPRETGYTDNRLQRKKGKHPAYFEQPVEARLERTGYDGLLLEMVYSAETQGRLGVVAHIANTLGLEKRTIERRINAALRYISGKCPRWMICDRCTQKDCERRGRSPRNYNDFKRHKKDASRVG